MAFDNFHNYFELLVIRKLQNKVQDKELPNDEDYLGDIACVALNQLPSRYVRHDVDMAFYMTIEEREDMEKSVDNAVDMAIEYVNKHRDNERPSTYSQ